MKASRFNEVQIIGILREQESGAATADVCRKHGISSATFYKWKAKCCGLDVTEARRLRTLEAENAKLLDEAMPDNAMMKETRQKMMTPAVRREAVAHLDETFAVSQRRACTVIGVDPSAMRYRSVRPDETALRERPLDQAAVRRRFGHRRLHVLLSRGGMRLSHKLRRP